METAKYVAVQLKQKGPVKVVARVHTQALSSYILQNILKHKEHSLVTNGLRIPGLLFVVESGYSIFYLLWAAKET
jgi:hypothetical protein